MATVHCTQTHEAWRLGGKDESGKLDCSGGKEDTLDFRHKRTVVDHMTEVEVVDLNETRGRPESLEQATHFDLAFVAVFGHLHGHRNVHHYFGGVAFQIRVVKVLATLKPFLVEAWKHEWAGDSTRAQRSDAMAVSDENHWMGQRMFVADVGALEGMGEGFRRDCRAIQGDRELAVEVDARLTDSATLWGWVIEEVDERH